MSIRRLFGLGIIVVSTALTGCAAGVADQTPQPEPAVAESQQGLFNWGPITDPVPPPGADYDWCTSNSDCTYPSTCDLSVRTRTLANGTRQGVCRYGGVPDCQCHCSLFPGGGVGTCSTLVCGGCKVILGPRPL